MKEIGTFYGETITEDTPPSQLIELIEFLIKNNKDLNGRFCAKCEFQHNILRHTK